MEASLTPAAGITTTTNGTYVAIQPIGDTEPIAVEIFGRAFRASGAYTATMVIQYSADGSSFSTHSTHALSGTSQSKPFSFVAKIPYPFVRLNISAIADATIVARLRMA